jgi:EmrB/QacA subfamily drug resistance transporter
VNATNFFPQPRMTPQEIRRILLGVLLTMFLAALDQTIVAPALPTIARDLHEFDSVSWVVTAYLLSATVTTPILGKLSDLYGRKNLMLGSVGVFILGSLACALAPTMFLLICGRAVQGAGGGALISLANTIVADVVSPRERGRYQGYFASVFALASVAGPVLGGMFAQYLSWTMIFWINIPLGLLAIVIARGALAHLPTKGVSHHIDYLGSALMATATICLLLALTWGGHTYPWLSAPILSLFTASVVLCTLFLRQQSVAIEPLLPLSLLRNPVIRMTSILGFMVMVVYVGASVYVPLYLEFVCGMDAYRSGMVLIALMVGVVGGALISGQYMRFIGKYKLPPLIGVSIASAALFYLALGASVRTNTEIVVVLTLSGIGLGTAFPPMMVSTQNAAAGGNLGIATANHAFFRSLGGAVGVSLFGAIIFSMVAAHIGMGQGRDLNDILQPGPALDAARPYLGDAFAAFFATAAGLGVLSVVCFAFLKEIPLRQHASGHAGGQAGGEIAAE